MECRTWSLNPDVVVGVTIIYLFILFIYVFKLQEWAPKFEIPPGHPRKTRENISRNIEDYYCLCYVSDLLNGNSDLEILNVM